MAIFMGPQPHCHRLFRKVVLRVFWLKNDQESVCLLPLSYLKLKLPSISKSAAGRRPCLIKNPGAQKNALLDSHIYPEGSNFIRPPIILSGARNKTVVAVGFSEDRTNTCS